MWAQSVHTMRNLPARCQRFRWWRCRCVPSQSSSWGRCRKPPVSSCWCRPSLRRAWQTPWSPSWPRSHCRSWLLCGSWHLWRRRNNKSKPKHWKLPCSVSLMRLLKRRRPSPAGTNSRTICPSSSLRSSHLENNTLMMTSAILQQQLLVRMKAGT